MGQNPVPLVNIKIGGKWMFIHPKMEPEVLPHGHFCHKYTPFPAAFLCGSRGTEKNGGESGVRPSWTDLGHDLIFARLSFETTY